MIIDECDIQKYIKELEELLKRNELLYANPQFQSDAFKNRLLMQSFNIESQLYALHFVLGKEYTYKHM